MPKTTAGGRQTPATRQIVPTGTSAPSAAQKAAQGAVDKAGALKELASRQLAKRRLLPFIQRMNPRYLAGWVHEDICRRLERFSDDVEKGLSPRLMLLMPPRHGKACAVGTPVPTPDGFKPIETLVPGDFVFGRDGRPTRVVAVSPIWHDRELFEVVSDDGAAVVVDAEHEWTARLCRKRPVYKTKTTRALYERTGERKPALMTYGAAQYPELTLPIKPYVLGAWLGDGCSQHATMTQGAQDFAFMRAELEKEGVVTSTRVTAGTFGLLGLQLQLPLRQLGLLNNKHIPEVYLRASPPQRHALLQGLIDTDGHVAPDGQVEFCAVNEQLAYQVLGLVRSLGVKASMVLGDATLNGMFISKKYRVMFYMAGAARMPRKAARCRNGVRSPHRFISIKPAGRGDTVCIQVEAQDHQYLVGHGYLLTHNSEIASKTFPAWHLGRFPDHEIIACSYNVGLAMGFSRKVQQLFDDPAYQNVFDARLNPNHRAAEEWGVHGRLGGYVAAGVGGGITGKGAHVLIIDDPIKNAEEADSADTREKLWDWYGSTAYTRLAPGAGVLVIQTWWHDSDLAGKLQQAMANDAEADQFEIIKYPALAEAAEFLNEDTDEIVRIPMAAEATAIFDPVKEASPNISPALYASYLSAASFNEAVKQGHDTTHYKFLRAQGAALHAERYDVKKLRRIKAVIPARFWSALYQQNPVPDDGSYFTKDQFKRGPLPSLRFSKPFIAWDFAISEKKVNDYTVGTVGLQDHDDILHAAEVVRFKSGNAFFIVESILNLAKRWYHPSLTLGFEDGQIYRSIEALLKKRMRELKFYPSIVVLRPITDKLARARVLQGRMQQGMVSFSHDGAWYDTVRNEMLRFPAGVHDDCVDSMAWMAQMAVGSEPPRGDKPKALKSWKDRLSAGNGTTSHMAA